MDINGNYIRGENFAQGPFPGQGRGAFQSPPVFLCPTQDLRQRSPIPFHVLNNRAPFQSPNVGPYVVMRGPGLEPLPEQPAISCSPPAPPPPTWNTRLPGQVVEPEWVIVRTPCSSPVKISLGAPVPERPEGAMPPLGLGLGLRREDYVAPPLPPNVEKKGPNRFVTHHAK